MLKTNRLLTAGAAFVAASVIGFAASAQTKWDMPTPYGDTNFHTVNIAEFAKDVEAATNGKLTIQIHSAGSLLKHPEIKNAVRKGVVPLGEVLISRLSNEDPIFELDSVPFLATSYDAAKKLYDASRPVLEKKLDAQGLMLLFAVPWPPQGIYSKGAISSMDDLKGMRFRAYNAATERIAQLAGAVPTQVEVPDLPTAFSTGRVQAMITSPSTGANSKAWDYLDHYYDAQAWLPKNMVIVNKAAFEALPADVQTAVKEAAATAETRGWEASKTETEEKTKMLADNGIEVAPPSEALDAGFKEIGATMVKEWQAKAGDDGKTIIEAFSK
ncbi:TRAP-type C4-dicarboxylate transport system substrate-binding protein [Breoghania corrubedonensis]|uniref:TRAP-type C4-dicarboxylate transport system substrate-binding protein n=1 Tax=Breoghania corrubedonensis TaxID=665038 RepID=A0A2T5V500_9HYPH|nr:TRAP transporter substrate-binding protein [Breoghania corrubedonensis]PTW58824.1 TRAP-type C4-dicarboxylate transport system substrate-binding protein [Breoghania corrubedonensis]